MRSLPKRRASYHSLIITNKNGFCICFPTEFFGNENPIHLEIGCGKGQFVCEMAKRNPDVNFIAVEKVKNVIVAACEKAKEEGLTNVKFIAGCAEYLPRFIPENSVELIYLNFSCPFPKAKYAFFGKNCAILAAHKLNVGETAVLPLKCADGQILSIDSLQPDGKKPMDAKSFLNGYKK